MVSSLIQAIVPVEYSLSQAYPNPFNPVTMLSFALPDKTKVILEVYDINGRIIVQLVNSNIQDGYHSVVWDAASAASGLYIIEMRAGGYVSTQKLMLVK